MVVLIFSVEYHEEGIPFYYGQWEGKLHRWEPIATRLRWGEAGLFRRKAEERRVVGGFLPAGGLLPVIGPVAVHGEKLIGWEVLPGEPLFANDRASLSLEEALAMLEPLFTSYQAYHRQGLTVGCPDWRRIFIGPQGITMPDPFLLSSLATPQRPIPTGLLACHPPEIYQQQRLNQKGDLFYLGLLIYIVLTGHLPYPLVEGWPTEFLRKGIMIPPVRWRPDIPGGITHLLERLLAVDPQRRPTIEGLLNSWQEAKTDRPSVYGEIKPPAIARLQAGWLYFRLHRRWWRPFLVGLAVVSIFLFYLSLGSLFFRREAGPPPDAMLATLIDQLADPTFPDGLLPGQPLLWADLLAAKEERRSTATTLLTRPILEIKEVIALGQERNEATYEVEFLWHHWRDNHWQTARTRERITIVKKGGRLEITGREQVN